MKIADIKKKIAEWEDFYGQDIPDTEAIGKCRTKSDCKEILEGYRRFLELQAIDASRDLDSFERKLGLY